MKSILVAVAFLSNALAYHDPDLNYHLSQVQNIQGCGDAGYSYGTPAIQLQLPAIKATTAQRLIQAEALTSSSGYKNAEGFSQNVLFQAAPQVTYQSQSPITYQAPITTGISSGYSAQGEVHGYATSAGLSSSASRTVIPQATYAQAPIIAKITAAPLQAKFTISAPKTTYVSQNSISQQSAYSSGSSARASLNSFTHAPGPVVSQVFAAPTGGYTTSPALKIQSQPQVSLPTYQYQAAVNQYQAAPASIAQVYRAPVATQYSSSSVTHVSSPRITQYAAPTFIQQAAPAIVQNTIQVAKQYAKPTLQYSAAALSHYSAPTATVGQYSASAVNQYSAPAVTQYFAPVRSQFSAPAVTQYSAPSVVQHSVPVVTQQLAHTTQYSTPSVSHQTVSQIPSVALTPAAQIVKTSHNVKNVHTDFLENYDAHPRYAFEYGVNDPHTGDIKQQKEERDGDVVKGQYSLVEPDGSVRTVNYVADWETGFHANVHNSKENQH